MRAKIVFLQLLVFFILIISANAFSQPVDLKIEYHDFIYAYSGDYVNIVGKLTNTGDINYKDILSFIEVSISEEPAVVR